jgi:hypothetical protein
MNSLYRKPNSHESLLVFMNATEPASEAMQERMQSEQMNKPIAMKMIEEIEDK